jgi:hypothetical protein
VENEDQPAENQATEPTGVEENTAPAAPAEETQTYSEETEGQPTEETQPEERKPSRAEREIRKLHAEAKQLKEQNQLLQGFGQPQVPTLQPGQEIDPAEYQAHVVQAADSIAGLRVQQALAQERAVTNVDHDVQSLPKTYNELNPESPETYIPELEKAVAEEYQEKAFRVAGYGPDGQPVMVLDPSVRLADIAKRHVDVARAAAAKSSANMRNAVAQSADTGAITPQGETKSDKPFGEKSIAEMEAQLGFVRR